MFHFLFAKLFSICIKRGLNRKVKSC